MHVQIAKRQSMESGETGDVMKKKISFGLSVADEKIELIDILSEDDYFLVSSPLCDNFRQSASFPEFERMEQKEQESRRPSFLRRSLAWDSAFSNSAGVLDPDELSFINKGFINTEASLLPADHEIRNRRLESESNRSYLDFSANWFELEPSIFKYKYSTDLNVKERSPKSRLKKGVQSYMEVHKPCRNEVSKVKSDLTWTGKSKDSQGEAKMKKESTIRRLDNKNLSEKPNLSMDIKSVRTGSATANSTLYRRRTNLRKPQHSPSIQTPEISTHAEKKKGMSNSGFSTHPTTLLSHQFCSPAGKSPSISLTSPIHKQRRSVDVSDVKEASHLQRRQNGSLSAKSVRPSESVYMRNHGAVRSRKMPQKVMSEESSCSKIAQTMNMVKTRRSEFGKNVKRLESDKQDEKELEILCRNLDAVALDCKKNDVKSGGLLASASKQEKQLLNSAIASSTTSSRTPLAEKRSDCNSVKASALRMEMKKERLVQRAPSVRYYG